MKIEIEHVSKKIKDALVLDDVCMTLESGNIYGFQGAKHSCCIGLSPAGEYK